MGTELGVNWVIRSLILQQYDLIIAHTCFRKRNEYLIIFKSKLNISQVDRSLTKLYKYRTQPLNIGREKNYDRRDRKLDVDLERRGLILFKNRMIKEDET